MIACTVVAIIGVWLLAAVGVRLALDWSDSMPYGPEAEVRYIVIALAALTVGFGGTIAAIIVAVVRLRGSRR